MPRGTSNRKFVDFDIEDLPPDERAGRGAYDDRINLIKSNPGQWKSIVAYDSRTHASSLTTQFKNNKYGPPEASGLHFATRKVDPELLPEGTNPELQYVVFGMYRPDVVSEEARQEFARKLDAKKSAAKKKATAKKNAKPKEVAGREEKVAAQKQGTTVADTRGTR